MYALSLLHLLAMSTNVDALDLLLYSVDYYNPRYHRGNTGRDLPYATSGDEWRNFRSKRFARISSGNFAVVIFNQPWSQDWYR